ncbi:hypothetical protein DBL02_04710 [Acinetobacter oleivorans]|uniref:hypothetical protein n=1 Tax=Acinetobacter oleivorans TaxID=1148157 RepID=UPI000D31B229|nr:hypothetical protein [Acinetobacter oleivorans]PTV47624.1 hypothetical protein DBL02_04710 [Acinetobacter oleivorans]
MDNEKEIIAEKKFYQTLLNLIVTNFTVFAIFLFSFSYLWKIAPREFGQFGYYLAIIYSAITLIFYLFLLYKVYYEDVSSNLMGITKKAVVFFSSAIFMIGIFLVPTLFILDGKQDNLHLQKNQPIMTQKNGMIFINIPKEARAKVKVFYEE